MLRSLAFEASRYALLLVVLGSAPILAQVLVQSPLVQGQIARLDVALAAPGTQAAFIASLTGTGAGTCYPEVALCLGVLEPIVILDVVPVSQAGTASFSIVLPPAFPLIPISTQAVELSWPLGVFHARATNTVTAAVQPLSALSDTFGGTSLSPAWTPHNASLLSATVGGGQLRIEPTAGGPPASWYADDEGPALYRLVTGDFTVTAAVRAFDPANPAQPPPPSYRLGGLSLRDPSSSPGLRNWAHIAIGGGTATIPVAVEDKSTFDSQSDLVLHPIASAEGEIRATRQGPVISFHYRAPGSAAFQLLRSHSRPDLPPTLQVGPMVNSWELPLAIAVTYDSVDFSP